MSTAEVLSFPPPERRPREVPWTLDVLGAPEVAFVVYGEPAPQGSKNARAIYKGRGIDRTFTGRVSVHESSKKVKPWRDRVAQVAAKAVTLDHVLLDAPLVVDMVFTMPKGTSLPKWLDWHDRTPDLSKLTRSTEDALTGIVWKDDGRVTAYRRLEARFVGSDDPDTLDGPGALIRVWRVPDALIEARKAATRRRS